MIKMINMDKTEKKIKKGLKDFSEMFKNLKGALGIPDIERMKLPLEFKNEMDFENYCKGYIEKYKDEIIDYANEILIISNREKDSEELLELYMLLMGFPSFLVVERAKKNGLID